MQRTLDLIGTTNPVADLQRTIDGIGRAPFADFRRTLDQLARVQTVPDLGSITTELREIADQYRPVAQEQGEAVSEPDVRTSWWMFRLPLVAQLGLLAAALEALDYLGQFLADAAGEDVPTEVQTATQAVFAIVWFVMMLVEAKSNVPPEDGPPEKD